MVTIRSGCSLVWVGLLAATTSVLAQSLPAQEGAVLQAPAEARVGVDPVTHRLRPLTAAEARALDDAAPKAEAARPSVPLVSRVPGVRGMRLGSEYLHSSRAVVASDGRLQMDCVEGGDALAAGQAVPVQMPKHQEADHE